jgi:hypothetical protein
MWCSDTAVFLKERIALLIKKDYDVRCSCNVHDGDQKCVLNFGWKS